MSNAARDFPVRITVFGQLSVTMLGQQTVTHFRTHKTAAALACLALRLGQPVSRETLCEALWPDAAPSAQRGSLSVAIHAMRQLLEPSPIESGSVLLTDRHHITLSATAVSTDLKDYEVLLALADTRPAGSIERAKILEEAVRLYNGGLLSGFYDESIVREQERRSVQYLDTLLLLCAAWEAAGDGHEAEAIDAARRAVDADPFSESANHACMRTLARDGRTSSALQAYAAAEALYKSDLQAEPPDVLRDLADTIRRGAFAPQGKVSVAAAAGVDDSSVPNNLPAQTTPLIGRAAQLENLTERLTNARILTLIGPGGAGKTRLALESAAARLAFRSELRDGVWFVELAPLTDGSQIAQTVANALSLMLHPDIDSLASLTRILQSKKLLLLLDNAEHVLDACAHVADAILRSCPDVRILVTSREPLGIAGEMSYSVPSLSVPERRIDIDALSLNRYGATRLFVERATTGRSSFVVTDGSAPAVARICHRLDGLPLAIELAAARTRSLSIEEIDSRLDNRFRLLISGSRVVSTRHQTLRSLIDWSYDLLTDNEKIAFRRLSVFHGGWTLAAAEAIVSDSPASEAATAIDTWEVLDLLTALIEKSLVTIEPSQRDGEDLRYRFLESIHDYARERLEESNEAELVRDRFAGFYAAFADRTDGDSEGLNRLTYLRGLDVERENLRAAFGRFERGGDADEALREAHLRLASALGEYWSIRGLQKEGQEHLRAAVSRAGSENFGMTSAPDRLHARALYGLGILNATSAGAESSDAVATLRQSAEIAASAGDRRLACRAALLEISIRVSAGEGDLDERNEEMRSASESDNDLTGIMMAQLNRGYLASRLGDGESALRCFEAGERLAVRHSDPLWECRFLFQIARRVQASAHAESRARFEDALRVAKMVGDVSVIRASLEALGDVAVQSGDLERAQVEYKQFSEFAAELEDRRAQIQAVTMNAMMATVMGDYEVARASADQVQEMACSFGFRAAERDALVYRGIISANEGRTHEAEADSKAALVISRELDDTDGIATALWLQGYAAMSNGNLDLAREKIREARQIRESCPNPFFQSFPIENLAIIAYHEGDIEEARRLIELTITRNEANGREAFAMRERIVLAQIEIRSGNLQAARDALAMAFGTTIPGGIKQDSIRALEATVALSHAAGDPARALRLLAAATAARERIGSPRWPHNAAETEALLASIRANLDPSSFMAAWQAGTELTLEEAAGEAL